MGHTEGSDPTGARRLGGWETTSIFLRSPSDEAQHEEA